jgi:uncharacterized protein (DUF1786 family)
MSTSNPSVSFQPDLPDLLDRVRILAIDVGAGTQDALLYDSTSSLENCVKLVLPSQTQIVAGRVRAATEARRPVFLTGVTMGGGATSAAVSAHLAAGLAVFATPAAARTIHNDLERVQSLGVSIVEESPPGAERIECADVDLPALGRALGEFGISLPECIAIAVQDHGYLPDAGGRELRYEYLRMLLAGGGYLVHMVYREPPEYMVRMHAVRETTGAAHVTLMDTGAAAVLGALGDAAVGTAAARDGAVLINIGNMHTFGVAIREERIFGLFEHHTGDVTPQVLDHLTKRLQTGELSHDEVVAWGGHGAAFAPGYVDAGPFPFVAVTGPNRHLAGDLPYHRASPHGDMMLAGAFGLVEGTLRLLDAEGYNLPVRSLVRVNA